MSLVYTIKEVEETDKYGLVSKKAKLLPQEMISEAAKVDIHVHSYASGHNIIPNKFTRWLGVHECYTRPSTILGWTINHPFENRRMNFSTISDHDVVFAAEDLRERYPEKSFTSCEYTVRVGKLSLQKRSVHIGVVGLEYAGGGIRPLSRKEVYELHEELDQKRKEGWQEFFEYCDKVGVVRVTNHLALLMATKKEARLTAEEVYEIARESNFIEINGDCQLENIVAIELALRFNKPIVAGSDSHAWRRLGNQYTVTTVPVKTPYEFIQALRQGKVGIGSKFPVYVDKPMPSDVMMRAFNGTPLGMFEEAEWIHLGFLSGDYLPREGMRTFLSKINESGIKKIFYAKEEKEEKEYHLRKMVTATALAGITGSVGTAAGYIFSSFLAGLGGVVATGGLILAGIALLIGKGTRLEKKNFAYWTRDLYDDLQNLLADHDTEPLRKRYQELLQQANSLEKRVKEVGDGDFKKFLEETRLEKLEDAASQVRAIDTLRKTYDLKHLRIPHDLVGIRGWLERVMQTDYDLSARDFKELLQGPVVPEPVQELALQEPIQPIEGFTSEEKKTSTKKE